MSVRRLDPVQPPSFNFSPENQSWAKKITAKFPAGKQASAVIQLLWRAQEQEGWVSKPAIETVARMLDMAYIRVYEVATFYTMFHLSPVGRRAHIQVCGTTPCQLRGAEDLIKVCQRRIHHDPHHVNEDGSLSWEEVECLGSCVNAPMIQVFKDTYEDLTPESLEKLIDDFQVGRSPKPGPQNGRQYSMAMTGQTTLTDKSLYGKQRTFKRVEAPPPAPPAAPVPAAPAAAAPAAPAAKAPAPAAPAPPTPPTPPPASTNQSVPPSPGNVKPAAAEIRPVSTASQATDTKKQSDAAKEQTAAAAGTVTTEKTQAETGVVRTTKDKVVKSATKLDTPPAPVAKSAKSASSGPELLKKPRGKADDLKLIWGVGPAFEKLLNKTGIWHFDQIASWSSSDIDKVDALLKGFQGRIRRDDWVSQAKKLASGWRPDNPIGDKPGKK